MQDKYDASKESGKTQSDTASYIMTLVRNDVISNELAKSLIESLYGAKKLSMSECLEIESILGGRDPVMDLVYARIREIKMLESLEDGAGTLTVGKLMSFLKDLDPDDIVEVYDFCAESSVWPKDIYVPDVRDTDGHKRLIIEIDTD